MVSPVSTRCAQLNSLMRFIFSLSGRKAETMSGMKASHEFLECEQVVRL